MKSATAVLLIDDDPDFRALVQHYLSSVGDVKLTGYDPESQGEPGADFPWQRFDLLLLDYQLGGEQDGLTWLARYREEPGFPPTVLVTAQGDEYVAVRALKLGAEDYIRKQDLDAARLLDVVRTSAAGVSPVNAVPETPTSLDLPAETSAGELLRGINGYSTLRKIGEGTQSRIYLAERREDGLEVALKIVAINPKDARSEDTLRRFEREAAALAMLDSPYVVHLFEQAFARDCGYLAMEHLPGGGLRTRMKSGLSEASAVSLMRQLLLGLEVVHAADVIHRDLKPGNILLRADGTLVIADFGISRPLESDTELTTIGMLVGTPAYMSPEQCLGQVIDGRTDLYSAGILFYEMLVGRRPFTGRPMAAVLHQHVHAEVPPLPARLAAYEPLIKGLLAKSPDDRIPDATQALLSLNEASGQTVAV